MRLVVADVGGTHIRFAIAKVKNQRDVELEKQIVIRTADYFDLKAAWSFYKKEVGQPLPPDAAIAVACPTNAEILHLTNNQWTISTGSLSQDIGVNRLVLLNDFEAVGHAVLHAPAEHLQHVCGPELSFSTAGIISVVGPGTGMGVAQIFLSNGLQRVVPTEGGHIGFAPIDDVDDAILERMRRRHGRVSVERVGSGPSLVDIYEVLAETHGNRVERMADKALWAMALSGTNQLATAALDRFCLTLGAIAGDIALAQGANSVVIAGGVGLRLTNHLASSRFKVGFTNKGRFSERMAAMPVKLITIPQPGLVGAALAFTSSISNDRV